MIFFLGGVSSKDISHLKFANSSCIWALCMIFWGGGFEGYFTFKIRQCLLYMGIMYVIFFGGGAEAFHMLDVFQYI